MLRLRIITWNCRQDKGLALLIRRQCFLLVVKTPKKSNSRLNRTALGEICAEIATVGEMSWNGFKYCHGQGGWHLSVRKIIWVWWNFQKMFLRFWWCFWLPTGSSNVLKNSFIEREPFFSICIWLKPQDQVPLNIKQPAVLCNLVILLPMFYTTGILSWTTSIKVGGLSLDSLIGMSL